jgi:hypothetical protein
MNGADADKSAMLDVASTTKGLLIPRVALQSITDVTTIPSPAVSLLVYNTNPAMTGGGLGFWYFNGTIWDRLAASATASDAWLTLGNSGTNPAANFIGTLDAQDFVVKTNGSDASKERLRFLSDGRIVINNTTASANDLFSVYGTGTSGAINNNGTIAIAAYSSLTNVGVYGENSGTGYGVFGTSVTTGTGVRGFNPDNGTGVTGRNNGAGRGVAGYNFGTGLGIYGQSSGYLALLCQTSSNNNLSAGVFGVSQFATGNGTIGAGNNLTQCLVPGGGCGTAGSGTTIGIYGTAVSTTAGTQRSGGYFASNANTATPPQFSNYTYVAAMTTANLSRKIEGPGTVNTVVKAPNGEMVTLTCPEAPEILFEDYGIGELVNGESHITIDPVFSANIHVDGNHPLKVYIQPEGDCNGVYVFNKSAAGFDVRELNNGKSNIKFAWHIVANRANETYYDGTIAPYADQRFTKAMTPQSAGAIKIPEVSSESALVK